MKAAEILNRYANGERNFRGENLRGLNFRNQDFSGADFCQADIRGTNFRGSNLSHTKLLEIDKAGLSPAWMLIHLIVGFVSLFLTSFFFCTFSFSSLHSIFFPQSDAEFLAGTCFVFALASMWFLFLRKGVRTVSVAVAGAFAGSFSVAIAWGPESYTGAVSGLFAGAFTGSLSVIGAFIVAEVLAVGGGWAVSIISVLAGVLSIAGGILATVAVSPPVVVLVVGLFVTHMALAILVAKRSLCGDLRYLEVCQLSVAWSSMGGTTFHLANLEHANFSASIIKNSDLRASSLFQTVWCLKDPDENLARVKGTYLANRDVFHLVCTLEGNGMSFDRLDLRGVNLTHANLRGCSFRASDLSGANLHCADLTRAILTQTQLDNADLTSAILTGAIIEDWGITINTQLQHIQCRYVYMRDLPSETEEKDRHRKPDDLNQEFEDGDFSDFIKPLADTLDLYHNRDVDPRAIAIAFKRLSEDNPDANLKIIAMESRGDGKNKFLLRAQTEEQADKSALGSQYTENYNQARSLPQKTQLELAQDRHIRSLERFLKQAIDRPSFQVQGVNYMSGPGNINFSQDDRSIHVGGDMTGNVVGDQNTADIQIQQANLPAPQAVNIHQEVAALKQLLTQFKSEDQRKISNALSDAEDELKKPKPDKDEVGQALGRALDYAQKAEGFASSIDKLRPHVQNAAAWLGKNWYKLLPLVGLAA